VPLEHAIGDPGFAGDRPGRQGCGTGLY